MIKWVSRYSYETYVFVYAFRPAGGENVNPKPRPQAYTFHKKSVLINYTLLETLRFGEGLRGIPSPTRPAGF